MKETITVFAVTVTALMGCSFGAEDRAPEEPLPALVTVDDGRTFAGELVVNGTHIEFVAVEGELSVDVTVSINTKKSFVMWVQPDLSGLDYQGRDQIVTQRDKDALAALHVQLREHVHASKDDRPLPHLVTNMVSWLSASPLGFAHPDRSMVHKSRSDDGVKCRDIGQWVTAKWSDDRGDGKHSEYFKVNSSPNSGSQCLGRCGGGCDKWWAISSYTQDCLEHDICLWKNPGAPTTSPTGVCGDEWIEAADDYLLGVPNGCWG